MIWGVTATTLGLLLLGLSVHDQVYWLGLLGVVFTIVGVSNCAPARKHIHRKPR